MQRLIQIAVVTRARGGFPSPRGTGRNRADSRLLSAKASPFVPRLGIDGSPPAGGVQRRMLSSQLLQRGPDISERPSRAGADHSPSSENPELYIRPAREHSQGAPSVLTAHSRSSAIRLKQT